MPEVLTSIPLPFLIIAESISSNSDELVLALESLGYKQADIKNVVIKVDQTLNIEAQIKEALKLLMK